MCLDVKLLGEGDESFLKNVAAGVFDASIDKAYTTEFLRDPRHHLVIAIDSQTVVGMASGVHYIHPDKGPELWINEVGVTPSHRKRGIAAKLLGRLIEAGKANGCTEAWVLTHRSNQAAMKLYSSRGGRPDTEDQVMFSFKLNEK